MTETKLDLCSEPLDYMVPKRFPVSKKTAHNWEICDYSQPTLIVAYTAPISFPG